MVSTHHFLNKRRRFDSLLRLKLIVVDFINNQYNTIHYPKQKQWKKEFQSEITLFSWSYTISVKGVNYKSFTTCWQKIASPH